MFEPRTRVLLTLLTTTMTIVPVNALAQLVADQIVIEELQDLTTTEGTGEYDQIDYPGSLSQYTFVANPDDSYSVTKPDGTTERLVMIDGFWFQGEEEWYSINDVNAQQPGSQTISGSADRYSQVDYPDSSTNYIFTLNADLSVKVEKPNGSEDTLKDIDGIWFVGEQKWYAINTLITPTSEPRTYTGTADEYDQVDYAGSREDYTFEFLSAGRISVTRRSGGTDTLIEIDGIWFQQEQEWYSIDDLTSNSSRTLQGTDGYEQVDYPGDAEFYGFERISSNTVVVTKPNGATDTLIDYDGFWFLGEEEWYSIEDALALEPPAPPPPTVTPQVPYTEPDTPDLFGTIGLSQHTNFCISTPGVLGRAVISNCSDSAAQRFSFAPHNGAFQIRSQDTGRCLGVEGASNQSLAIIRDMSCSFADHQLWTLDGDVGTQNIKSVKSGLCIDVFQGRIQNDQRLIQYRCGRQHNQLFNVTAPVGDGKLRFAQDGRWEGPYRMPLVPAGAISLPNGRVLGYSATQKYSFGSSAGRTSTAIFDPIDKTSTEKLVSNTGHDMFCPGTAVLADGRVMVTGGNSDRKTSIFDPTTEEWSSGRDMTQGRGYHSMTTLSDGSVLSMGGSWSGGRRNKAGELWTTNNQWEYKSGLNATSLLTSDPQGIYRSDNHMWIFTAPNGKVFHAGPSRTSNWIDTQGSGSVEIAVNRPDDEDGMNGTAVMYDVGKILVMGGGPNYTNGRAISSAFVFDLNNGDQVTIEQTGSMYAPRGYMNSVVLPSGEVVTIGGQTFLRAFSDADSVLSAEIWSPDTGEFRRLADMVVPRNYHSIALLLKDGRILTGGGGLCGGCSTNHPDVEIFTPPYLLNADGTDATRPVLSGVPNSVSPGESITVEMDTNANHTFALVRTSAVTHSVNNDERRIPVQVSAQAGTQFTLDIHSNPAVLIPGSYYLFAMNAQGVPSEASTILVPAP